MTKIQTNTIGTLTQANTDAIKEVIQVKLPNEIIDHTPRLYVPCRKEPSSQIERLALTISTYNTGKTRLSWTNSSVSTLRLKSKKIVKHCSKQNTEGTPDEV